MSLILNIDTSLETAFVCIAEKGIPRQFIQNTIQKEHAIFLHKAIEELVSQLKISLQDLSAIGVTKGPGSYTGLRVGMSSAKGLAYALNKPLITIGTLEMMAIDVIQHTAEKKGALFCPLIDARRMEVFTSMYDSDMNELNPPVSMVLDKSSFEAVLNKNRVYFFGSGASKLEQVISHQNAIFVSLTDLPGGMSHLSQTKFFLADFTDLAHSEPLYVKEFHSS